jgi:ABC-type lipoprotein export system ATPase subunit
VTFVVATHDAEIASCMDRVVRLNEGRVVSDQRLRAEPVRLSGIR